MYNVFNWVLVEVSYEDKTYYKLIAQVGVGLNDWRINSGIVKITSDEFYFYVHGTTGSVYQCLKESQHLSNCTRAVLDRIGNFATVIPIENILKDHLLKPN